MRDIARRSLLAGISAVPAVVIGASLPSAVLAHPVEPAAHVDADLIALSDRVVRLGRLKDQASDRLSRRQEAARDAQQPKPAKLPADPNATFENRETDLPAGVERVFTATFRKPSGESVLAETAHTAAVMAWEADNARLNEAHGVDAAEDLNDNLMDSLTKATTGLAAMVAHTPAGMAVKARAYLTLVNVHGWWSDGDGDWIAQLATSIARDALVIGASAA